MRREYKKLCNKKKKRKRKRWEREIEGVRIERQVWKVMGKKGKGERG